MSVDAANVFMLLDVYYVRHDLVLGTYLRLLRHASETATFESFFRGRTFLNKNVARQLIPDECWIYARKKTFVCVTGVDTSSLEAPLTLVFLLLS